MLKEKISDVLHDVIGGYTPEKEDIDNNCEYIEYEVESVIPSSEILEELLQVAVKVRNEK